MLEIWIRIENVKKKYKEIKINGKQNGENILSSPNVLKPMGYLANIKFWMPHKYLYLVSIYLNKGLCFSQIVWFGPVDSSTVI